MLAFSCQQTAPIEKQTIDNLENVERPADADTVIATKTLPEFLEKKYPSDPLGEEDVQSSYHLEHQNNGTQKIKTTTVSLPNTTIQYTYTYFKNSDSGIAEIKINGLKRSFVTASHEPARDFGDIDISKNITLYTIAGEKYLLLSCTPIDEQSWFSTIVYGMLTKLSDSSSTVTLLATVAYPGDAYLNGDFYIRQNRYNGKVFSLMASPATFDEKSYPDNIFLSIKELNL